MNRVDIADQLRGDLKCHQITRRSWMPYWFWLLDTVVVNAFLLWRWECESVVVGRKNENKRSQRAFRVALVQSLLGREGPAGRNRFLAIRITRGHQLLLPTISRFPAYTHQIRRGSPYRECYYCRWKHFKGQIRRDEINRRRTCCADCDVPLCRGCFIEYYRAGGSIWEGYYEGPKVSITSL
jgi:hypothetical protein